MAWTRSHPVRPAHVRPGFTLVETVAAMVVVAVLAAITSTIIFSAVHSYADAATGAQLHTEASGALDRITRELRRIANDPNVPGIQPQISAVTASSIAFGGNSSLSLSGSTVVHVDSGGASRVLLQDVTSFAVQAYDQDNGALGATLAGTACYPIRRLQITVTLTRQGIVHSLRARIFLRSVMAGA